jgi:hypothetical protein
MRKAMIITLLLVFSTALGMTGTARAVHPAKPEPQNLRSYVGKYPSQLLRGVPSLKQRLKVLLGANYSLFMERLQTEMPIEDVDGALVGRGCMAHSCGEEEAVMVINLADGKLHCAILSAKFGGKFKVFSEDKAHIPAALNRTVQER